MRPLARFRISAHVLTTRPLDSTTDWLKLKPFKLKAIVDTPRDVNQIPTTGHSARKKCSERLLLKDAYWNSNREQRVEKPPFMPRVVGSGSERGYVTGDDRETALPSR